MRDLNQAIEEQITAISYFMMHLGSRTDYAETVELANTEYLALSTMLTVYRNLTDNHELYLQRFTAECGKNAIDLQRLDKAVNTEYWAVHGRDKTA